MQKVMNKGTPWLIYKQNKPCVLQQLKDGRIDYMDLTEWSLVDKYFAFLIGSRLLDYTEKTYPNSRERKKVPVGFLLC